MESKSVEHVHDLISQAARAGDSGDAMRFAQAANNAANALLGLDTLAHPNTFGHQQQ